MEALRQHKAAQKEQRLRCGVAWHKDPEGKDLDLVITGLAGEPQRPSTVSTRFRSFVKALDRCPTCEGKGTHESNKCPACDGSGSTHEFEGLRFHDLRHSHCSILLAKGVPPHVVSQRLGHSTVGFTLDHYAHVLPDQQLAAARLFDTAIASGQ